MAKGEETDNVANVSNVSLKDIKIFISKYRTLPINKKQEDEKAVQNERLINTLRQAINKNADQDEKMNEALSQQYLYRSKQNYRQGYHRSSAFNEEDQDITDNEYVRNLQTTEHARKLDNITAMLERMKQTNQKALDLVELKKLVVDTINVNLERNNNVVNTDYNTIAQDVYNHVNKNLSTLLPSTNTVSNTDSLGLLKRIDDGLRAVKAEMENLKNSVETVKSDYTTLNDRIATTMNKTLMAKKAEFTKELIENQAAITTSLQSNKVIFDAQKETISKLDSFLAGLSERNITPNNIANSIIRTKETVDKLSVLEGNIKDLTSTVNKQTKINSSEIIDSISANLKSILNSKTNNNPNENLLSVTDDINGALRLANRNQELAVIKKTDDSLVQSVKDSNQLILDLAKEFEKKMNNQVVPSTLNNDELAGQVKSLTERSSLIYDELIKLQDGGTIGKKTNEALDAFARRVNELIDSNLKTVKAITEGEESKRLAIMERFNQVQSQIEGYQNGVVAIRGSDQLDFSDSVARLLSQLNNEIAAINNNVTVNVTAIENRVQNNLAVTFQNVQSDLAQRTAAFEQLRSSYMSSQQSSLMTEAQIMERLNQMLTASSSNWQLALDQRLEQLQLQFNTTLREFPFTPAITERGEPPPRPYFVTEPDDTTDNIVPTNSSSNSVNSTTNPQRAMIEGSPRLLAITASERYTALVSRAVSNLETDQNRVQLLEVQNRAINSINSNSLIDSSIISGIRLNNAQLENTISQYNDELMSTLETLRLEVVRLVNDPLSSETELGRAVESYSWFYSGMMNATNNTQQLNALRRRAPDLPPTTNPNRTQLVDSSNTFLQITFENRRDGAQGRITGAAPVLRLTNEVSRDGEVPSTFVPDNGNVNIETRVNPATNQTETLNASTLAAVPVIQLPGPVGGRDVVNDSVGQQVANQVKTFLDKIRKGSIEGMNREQLSKLISEYNTLAQTNFGDQTSIPLSPEQMFEFNSLSNRFNAAYAALENSDSQYPQQEQFVPGGEPEKGNDEEEMDTEDTKVNIAEDFKQKRNKESLERMKENRKKSKIKPLVPKINVQVKQEDGEVPRTSRDTEEDRIARRLEENQERIEYKSRHPPKKEGMGISRRRNVYREIEGDKENINKMKDYSNNSKNFLSEEFKKRQDKMFKGNGVHNSLEFRRKLLSLIKSGHVPAKKGGGVHKKLVCSLCNNDNNDDNYHITKSKEVLHKKCFEGKGMTKKRKLYEEDYGEDITPNSHDNNIRQMYENHSNAKQKELIDKVKLNNVHNDHMQSISKNNSLKSLIKNAKNSYIAWGQIDSKLFSLMCYLLGVLNNNKENASDWDYINYQVLRSKYLLNHKADPKKLKYIDIDTSNQDSIEKAIKSNPEILFDFDFNE